MHSETIGDRLRWLRAETRMSQRAVAKAASLGDAHVRVIEVENRDVQGSTATAIAGVFGVTVDWLLNGTGERPDADAVRKRVQLNCGDTDQGFGQHRAKSPEFDDSEPETSPDAA